MTDNTVSKSEPTSRVRRTAHSVAILLLGVIVPIALLLLAYDGLSRLSANVGSNIRAGEPAVLLQRIQPHLRSANDYAFFSLISAEHTNALVVANKQIMKVVVMQIGFSVVSIGMLLVVLGINEGGGSASGAVTGVRFDFKTGSTGVLVFVVGAAMAAAGGLLKNDYGTVPIPNYVEVVGKPSGSADSKILEFYRRCKADAASRYKECFVNTVEQQLAEGGL